MWVREGLLKLTAGNVADYDVIQADVLADAERFAILDCGFDPYGATQLITNLMGEGMPMTPVRQGYLTMSPVTKEAQRTILLGKLNHAGNPALRWQADMFAVSMDPAGNVKPDREIVRANGGKMDGIVATLMALVPLTRANVFADDDGEYEVIDY